MGKRKKLREKSKKPGRKMEMEKGGMGKNKLVRAAEMVQKFY